MSIGRKKNFDPIWMPCEYKQPEEAGTYLVSTAGQKIRIDRWDGEAWGLCRPRNQIKHRDKGRYKPHRAWCYLPKPYEERTTQ